MIDTKCKKNLRLGKYPHNFLGLGRLGDFHVTLHLDKGVKPLQSPPRSMLYHLRGRKEKLIREMTSQDVMSLKDMQTATVNLLSVWQIVF